VDRILGSEHLPEGSLATPSSDDEYLLRIWVFTRLDIDKCRQRQVAHCCRAGIDDLVRHFGTAWRACDYIMLADWVALVTKPQLAFALQDQEHFLFAMMAVERALSLPGRQDCQAWLRCDR